MASKITYGDKSQGKVSTFPTNQKYTFQDANEVKTVVNSHADDIDATNIVVSSLDSRIDTLESIAEVDVTSLSDFPAPVSNVITLDVANTIYNIRGSVDIGANRFVIGAASVKICGSFVTKDSITSTTTSALVTSVDFGVFIRELTITAISATKIIDSNGTGSESLQLFAVTVITSGSLGTIDNLKTVDIRDSFFTLFTSGFTLSGAFDAILAKTNLAEDFTGILLDLNGCTSDAISIGENAITLKTGGTFLEIAPSGANITTGGEGTIFGNKINIVAGGTPIVGYSTFEKEWGVSLNDKIKSSDRILPNGWGFYDDALTTPATQTFNTIASKIQIDGGGAQTDENHLPNSIKGLSSLWDVVNDEILPVTEGDSFDLRVNLVVDSKAGNPNVLIMELDIGGGATPTIVIARDDKTVTNTPPYALIYTLPFFTLSTFITNKGQLFFSTDTGSLVVSVRQVLIIRTSSGVT